MASSGIIQHNIMAMSSYRNYSNNTSALAKNLEKLSSALKINRAGDDAAGLAISEKMRAQITGLEVAQKNAKDGISLVQTAEGALTEVHSMLNRMVELASMSANGTYANDTDRTQLQKEMDQLSAEINRIADSANFNGIQLLDGNMDAGGDVVYTKGAFQFEAEHPAGISDSNITLPEVKEGKVEYLGDKTILHADGTKGGASNGFAINLGNLSVVKDGAIDITIGDNLTVTVENKTGKTITADDIAKAIANGGTGDGTNGINVTFKVDGAEITPDATGDKLKITLGDPDDEDAAVFELDFQKDRVTFEQTDGDPLEKMPQAVTIANAEPATQYQWGDPEDDASSTAFTPAISMTASTDLAAHTFGSNDTAAVEALGTSNETLQVTVGDVNFTIKLVKGEATEDTDLDVTGLDSAGLQAALEKKIQDLYNSQKLGDPTKDGETNENAMGTVTIALNSNKLDTGASASAVKATVTAEEAPEEITGEYTLVTEEKDSSGTQTVANSSIKDGSGTTATYNWQNGTTTSDLNGKSFTVEIGDKTYTVNFTGTPAGDEDVNISTNGTNALPALTAANVLAAIKENLKNQVAAHMGDLEDANATFDFIDNIDVQVVDGTSFKVTWDSTPKRWDEETPEAEEDCFSGWWNASTTVLHSQSDDTQECLASTVFSLEKLADADGKISEGTTITIGRDTYTFTYDKNKIGKDGYVVLNDGEDYDVAAEKLTEAAKGNTTYTVGHDKEGRITLTEIADQTNFDLTTMAGIEKSLGFKIATTRATDTSKGLTLQIGDTAESYNQLKVNIKDCHTKALGLDGISIANQADAAAAVDAIRDAINYVSDVRGTLGATQNRLDHTINNLSVMTENIQDAESTIRDTDIAKEMMEYTKNNIKVQAAQAMLAQANMLPQGVLQLLG